MGIKAKLVTAVIDLQDFEIVLEIFFLSSKSPRLIFHPRVELCPEGI